MGESDTKWRELRGNLTLVVAIAILAGVATFVVVRERLSDARDGSSQTK
jgi:hypothetical protein